MNGLFRNNGLTRKGKAIFFIAISLIALTTYTLGNVLASGSGIISDTTFEAGTNAITSTYVVFRESTTYYARNGLTGGIDYTSTNASYVIQTCLDLGGSTMLKDTGNYILDSTLTISKLGTKFYGETLNVTLRPSADITMIEISLDESVTEIVGDEQSANVEISSLKFVDDSASPLVTSKAAILIDNSAYNVSGVVLDQLDFQNMYDCISNDRGSATTWFWANTVSNCRFEQFRRYAIWWHNIADTVHENLWMFTTESDVDAILVENIAGGSSKIGGNFFHTLRIFNEKAVVTANAMRFENYHEQFFNDIIVDYCGGSGVVLHGGYRFFFTNFWSATNDGYGILAYTDSANQMTNVQITNSHFTNHGLDAIRFEANSTGESSGHIITNCGIFEVTSSYAGIRLIETIESTINGVTTLGSMDYGIYEDSNSDYNIITDSNCHDSGTVNILSLGTNTEVHSCFNGTSWIT